MEEGSDSGRGKLDPGAGDELIDLRVRGQLLEGQVLPEDLTGERQVVLKAEVVGATYEELDRLVEALPRRARLLILGEQLRDQQRLTRLRAVHVHVATVEVQADQAEPHHRAEVAGQLLATGVMAARVELRVVDLSLIHI